MDRRIPGIGATKTAGYRSILAAVAGAMYMIAGKVLDGAKARDPGNTGDVDVLRAGMLVGKITSSGKYAPSILGLTAEALDSDETALDLPAAVVTELQRRIGASGSFKLTGPAMAGGAVRTLTATYSGVSDADTVTIAALGVNEVQTVAIGGTLSAGGYRLRLIDKDGKERVTGLIAYNAVLADVQTALDAATAANAIVAGGTVHTAMTLTFSGASYAALPQALVEIMPDGLTGYTGSSVTRTTAGVDGRFVSGSLVQPADGSEVPLCILGHEDGLKVTDTDGTNLDVMATQLLVGGQIDASQIVNYPADASLRGWVKAQLRAVGLYYSFDDDF